jgi:hypothetical protein
MRLLALLAALAALGQQEPARAKVMRLAVLPIVLQGEHGSATISSIFNDVVSAAGMRLGLRVVSYEEMFAAAEEGLGDRVRDCGSDSGCISARLRTFNARLGLVVVVDLSSKPPLISLQLLDTDDNHMLASDLGEVEARETLSASIQERTRHVLEKGGFSLAGRILVEVDPPNAHITLGNGVEPDQGTPNRFTVAPGHYTVAAALEGWSAKHDGVEVAGGEESKVRIALAKETSILESPWLWVGIGAAVAAGSVAVLIATHKTTRCLCTEVGSMVCNCP